MSADQCRHFTGLMGYAKGRTCAAGVVYRDVVITGGPKGIQYPCNVKHAGAATCALLSLLTPEEVAAEKKEVTDSLNAMAEDLKAGRCIVCHEPAKQKQVGPCVYGDPCGHRMYQGRVTKEHAA